jgi:DNA-directed RNA polymerase beta subunit
MPTLNEACSWGDIGKVAIVVSAECLHVNGDKFTTLHGQKGVVTILNDIKMPAIKGRYADIVIGSSSIITRQTASQLLEAAYNMHCVTHMESSRSVAYSDIEKD